MDKRSLSSRSHRMLAAVIACLLGTVLSLLAWWSRTLALRPDTEAYYVEVVVLLLALLAFDAAIHPTTRSGVRNSRRGEELAVLMNALALTFLAGSIAYTASQQLASPATGALLPGFVVALLLGGPVAFFTLVINATLVMGRRPPGGGTGYVRAVVVNMIRRALGSVPVLVASIAVLLIQTPQTSPILSLPVASFMLWASWRIIREHEQG